MEREILSMLRSNKKIIDSKTTEIIKVDKIGIMNTRRVFVIGDKVYYMRGISSSEYIITIFLDDEYEFDLEKIQDDIYGVFDV